MYIKISIFSLLNGTWITLLPQWEQDDEKKITTVSVPPY